MDDYALFALRLESWPCLVVGASNRVAARRVAKLLDLKAQVHVVAPDIGTRIAEWAAAGRLTVDKRLYAASDLDGRRLAVFATDDDELNRRAGAMAQERGLLVNVASKGRAGDVLFPASYRSAGLEAAVHSNGTDIHRSLAIRDRLSSFLESSGATQEQRLAWHGDGAGMVFLIGAGPGAPDLLTLRALRAIQAADVVMCDHILGEHFLDQLDVDLKGKELIWLGSARGHGKRQGQVNEQLVAAARRGQVVARVKNGDPLVFGRGGEEAAYLDEAGIRWEFIPGLSSSVSTLTNAGFGVTNRGDGRSFAVVSARLAGGTYNNRQPQADSLIFLMGFRVMQQICADLQQQGWAADTAAVIIERGSLAFEKRVRGNLTDIADKAQAAGIDSPAILAVGVVAERRFVSPLRPAVLYTGIDASTVRQLGDVLHWPAEHPKGDGSVHPELAAPLPQVDALCISRPVEWQLLCQAHDLASLRGISQWWTTSEELLPQMQAAAEAQNTVSLLR